jgi:hypothetical protein
MSATIRITCNYTTPKGFEWAGKLNSSFHPPHALVDGQEKSLNWQAPTDISIAPGKHKLEVYFRVFDVLRMCAAETEIPRIADGETRTYLYSVELRDRYLNRGSLSVVD